MNIVREGLYMIGRLGNFIFEIDILKSQSLTYILQIIKMCLKGSTTTNDTHPNMAYT